MAAVQPEAQLGSGESERPKHTGGKLARTVRHRIAAAVVSRKLVGKGFLVV